LLLPLLHDAPSPWSGRCRGLDGELEQDAPKRDCCQSLFSLKWLVKTRATARWRVGTVVLNHSRKAIMKADF
jgi:hypothetical protein